ncbi:hypothetical protein M758_9G058000 [Ceratodon purpureus]|nr:hypothetical protein M758_9G058000 [Ceratodon purpureus]
MPPGLNSEPRRPESVPASASQLWRVCRSDSPPSIHQDFVAWRRPGELLFEDAFR